MKRKLTKKSLLKFGKFSEFTVGQLIDLHKYNYLIWVYCNSSEIDFFDDILDQLKIPLGERIEKPGKYPEKTKDFINNFWRLIKDEVGEEKYIHIVERCRKMGRITADQTKYAKKKFKPNVHSINTTK